MVSFAGNNEVAIKGAKTAAESRGYLTHVLSSSLMFNSKKLGRYFAVLAQYICEIFETRRTKFEINVELSELEFRLIREFGTTKTDFRQINHIGEYFRLHGSAGGIGCGGFFAGFLFAIAVFD